MSHFKRDGRRLCHSRFPSFKFPSGWRSPKRFDELASNVLCRSERRAAEETTRPAAHNPFTPPSDTHQKRAASMAILPAARKLARYLIRLIVVRKFAEIVCLSRSSLV
ncbi:hypothetical protein GQ607_000648 [Colletotrichum asianum]|uniref:Uncharacterized protein n=1 Tax=Colletotrichum asianum TaxID=702518 RepID=A0A8H3ZXW3_9PEZI|nr:hypothetical protein GQ607_000648 [Colletotrichum asianum]